MKQAQNPHLDPGAEHDHNLATTKTAGNGAIAAPASMPLQAPNPENNPQQLPPTWPNDPNI